MRRSLWVVAAAMVLGGLGCSGTATPAPATSGGAAATSTTGNTTSTAAGSTGGTAGATATATGGSTGLGVTGSTAGSTSTGTTSGSTTTTTTTGTSGGSSGTTGAPAQPIDLVPGESASFLRMDATQLFWVVRGTSTSAIRAVAKGGGSARTVATIPGQVTALLVDEGSVWLLNYCASCSAPTTLYRASKDGSSGPVAMLTGPFWGELAADASTLYFLDNSDPSNGTLLRAMPKGGGALRTVATAIMGEGMAVGDGYAFVDYRYGGVERVPTAGGAITTYSGEGNPAQMIRLDFDALYARDSDGKIWVVNKDGTGFKQLAGALEDSGIDFDVNAKVVYFTVPGQLQAVNADGTNARILASGHAMYSGVRVDDTGIFFIADGDIYRLPR